MDKKVFLNSAKIVINEIYNNTNIINISANHFYNVKDYIFDVPNDSDVILFKKVLVNLYVKPFQNPNLINALNLSDNLPYFKKQEIFKNLPFIHTLENYRFYLSKLFTLPSECLGGVDTFYKTIFWFIKSVDNCLLSNEFINTINNFVLTNKSIFHISKDHYDNYSTELQRYKKVLNGNFNTDDYKNFEIAQRAQEMLQDYQVQLRYKNKKLGTIGELAVFEFLKNATNACFVAKDLGNGFGYDMYFQIQAVDTIECLVEVKTTKSMSNNDYFYLSENEYNTMLNTLNNKNTKYIICRVNINNNSNLEYYLLDFVDSNTLRSTNYDQDHVEYYLEPNDNNTYCFVKKEYSKKL